MSIERSGGRRARSVASLLACLALVTAAGACTEGDDASTDAGGEAERSTSDDPAERFDALVAAAEESNHVVRMNLEGTFNPEEIRQLEEAFEERFGFPVTLESEPGHPSREIPLKVEQAAESGQGVVDAVEMASPFFVPLFDKGLFRQPDWEALASEWPLVDELRELTMNVESADGEVMSDYCMLQGTAPWVPVYNTDRVDPSEVEAFDEWEDLADPMWQGRLALDAEALGLYVFPFAEGWDEQRLTDFTSSLGELDPTLVSGGGAAVIQALLQGEGDIGIATTNAAEQEAASGAPLDYIIPSDFVPVSQRQICLVSPNVNDEAMAELFVAWYTVEGIPLQGARGGTPRFLEEEVDSFPAAQRVQEAGLSLDDLVFPDTREKSDMIDHFRDVAKAGIGAG